MDGQPPTGMQPRRSSSARRALVAGAISVALLGTIVGPMPVAAAAPSSWTQPGGSASHRSWNRNEQTLTPSTVSRLRLGWSQPVRSVTEPVVVGGRLFTVEHSLDTVSSLVVRTRDARTGIELWKRFLAVDPPQQPPSGGFQPVADGNRLLVPTGPRLVALDQATGGTVWKAVAEPGRLPGALVAADGVAAWLTRSFDRKSGVVRFFDVATGRERGRSAVIDQPSSALAVGPGGAYVGTLVTNENFAQSSLIALDLAGRQLWKRTLVGHVLHVTAAGDLIYVGTCYDEGGPYCWTTWAVRVSTGELAFSFADFSRASWHPAITAKRLFGDTGVRDRWTGKELPGTAFSGPLTQYGDHLDLAVAGGVVFDNRCVRWDFFEPYYNCAERRVEAFAEADGRVLPLPAVGSGRPIVAEGRLYVWEFSLVRMYQLS